MRIAPVMYGHDNYCWFIENDETLLLVDPGDAGPVLRALQRRNRTPDALLLTHHHSDHTGGVQELHTRFPGIQTVIHRDDSHRVSFPVTAIPDSSELHYGSFTVRILHTPGHTAGSVCYLTGDALFTGDTLFSAGCGRLFEADAAVAWSSLQRIAELPDETRIFPGHEYTAENLRFAETVDPGNPLIKSALHDLAAGVPRGLPSSVGREKQINPFLRCAELDSSRAPEDVFADFRARKDRF